MVGSNVLPQRLRAVKRTNVAAGPVTVREVKQEEGEEGVVSWDPYGAIGLVWFQ